MSSTSQCLNVSGEYRYTCIYVAICRVMYFHRNTTFYRSLESEEAFTEISSPN